MAICSGKIKPRVFHFNLFYSTSTIYHRPACRENILPLPKSRKMARKILIEENLNITVKVSRRQKDK